MKMLFWRSIFVIFPGILLLNSFVLGQSRQEPFHLIHQGTGAAALGMGGAFVAVANDLSAIYWNPAGLTQLKGLQIQADSVFLNGNEDFLVASELAGHPNQGYSLSGNQFQFLGISYALGKNKLNFVPAFAWRRTSSPVSTYNLNAPIIGNGPGIFRPYDYNVEYQNHLSGEENEYTFALGTRISKDLIIGGSWNLISGGQTNQLNSRALVSPVSPGQTASTLDVSVETTTDSVSGNYFTLGLLLPLGDHFQIGSHYRFSYTRTVDILLNRNSKITTIETVPEQSEISFEDNYHYEYKIPSEWSAGLSFRANTRFCVSTSLSFSDWADISYPTNRSRALQSSMIQWRVGGEYWIRSPRWALRSGFFRDNQPYSHSYSFEQYVDSPYHGFSFGVGYKFAKSRFDFAYVRETGQANFANISEAISYRDFTTTDASFSQNRFYLGVAVGSRN